MNIVKIFMFMMDADFSENEIFHGINKGFGMNPLAQGCSGLMTCD